MVKELVSIYIALPLAREDVIFVKVLLVTEEEEISPCI
jgi:hypothetical protein